MVLQSHGVVAKTAWCGIHCSSVLKSSACKFSELKRRRTRLLLLCVNVCLETLIFAFEKPQRRNKTFEFSHAFHLACCFALLKSKTVTIVFSGISISYYFDKTTVASNFIDIDDTASTELTRDNRPFCTREEKNKRKECYCRHTEL